MKVRRWFEVEEEISWQGNWSWYLLQSEDRSEETGISVILQEPLACQLSRSLRCGTFPRVSCPASKALLS